MQWRGLTQVERVDLYTRQSLHLLLWGFVAYIVFRAYAEAHSQTLAYGAVVVMALLTAGAGARVLSNVMALYPQTGPLPWRSITWLLVMTSVLLAVGLLQSNALRGAAVMVSFTCLTLALGGLRDIRVLVALLAGLALLPAVAMGNLWAAPVALAIALFLVFTVRISLWILWVVVELDRARAAQADLAVAEERLRFSRDVHDVLGRRLSTIAVQSELAATLATRGDDRAPDRMLEVRASAHAALREARELARGYRPTDLGQELQGARSLLASAGIGAEVSVEALPAAWQEPVAWVVREAVTNVLRHSCATSVSIRWESPNLCISNDGVSRGAHAEGAGLRGLRERLTPLGGSLAHHVDGDTFHLTARLPAGTDPASDLTEIP